MEIKTRDQMHEIFNEIELQKKKIEDAKSRIIAIKEVLKKNFQDDWDNNRQFMGKKSGKAIAYYEGVKITEQIREVVSYDQKTTLACLLALEGTSSDPEFLVDLFKIVPTKALLGSKNPVFVRVLEIIEGKKKISYSAASIDLKQLTPAESVDKK